MAAAFALAGCGGGGGSVQPQAVASAQAAASAGLVIARGTLTLRFPPGFQTAKSAKSVKRALPSATRRPAYVNPLAGNLLDIYINGVLVTNIDGVTPSHSATVAATPDGSQTLSAVPLYSTSTDVAVIEWDSSDTQILAVGENPAVAVSPGVAAALTVTMQMNATGFAIATDATGANATAFGGGFTTGSPGFPTIVYVYPTDPLGGYTSAAGYGGLPANMSVTGSASDNSKIGQQPRPGFLVSYAALASSISVTATTTNPAYFQGNNAQFPELNALYTNNSGIFSTLTSSQDTAFLTLTPYPQTFYFTSGVQYVVVPTTATQATITAAGASGGGGGGAVTATVPVIPGETLALYVGGTDPGGPGGYNGGAPSGGYGCNSGGAGASDVREGGTALANRIIVGGGSGGGGCDNGGGGGAGGAGGATGFAGGNVLAAGGGGGGGGGNSVAGGSSGAAGNNGYGPAGAGANGTLGAGGSGGTGGPLSCTGLGGSGGGGGYYGGGGGGGGSSNISCTGGIGGGGGGGGSSWVEPSGSGVIYNDGSQFGNGQITIVF